MISKNKIKHIQALHLKKNRDLENLFIVEGEKLVCEFINSRSFSVKEVYATADFVYTYEELLQKQQLHVDEISYDDLKKISLQSSPNQVLAIVEKNEATLNAELFQTDLTLFLDDIRDPGNLGTIIRIADWFGIKQIICSQKTTEVYNPKTVQASMGAILRTSVVYMDFAELKSILGNVPIYGAVLGGTNIYQTKLTKGIIIIGNEANGISDEIIAQLNYSITIPAASNNGSESLNAANACGIICAEFFRQLNY